MRHFFISLSTLCMLVICALSAQAQGYRYVDGAGNIHFVDSWKNVPRQYREQIVPATPTPVLDKKTLQKRQRERERIARDEKNRLERERKRREKEVVDAQKRRRIGASVADDDDTAKRRRRAEDDIEVIN